MLTVGLVGCGRVGIGRGGREGADLHYTHAGAYSLHPGTVVTAAADVDQSRLAACREVWGVTRLYRDYWDMLREERVDILSICTPEELHYPVIEAAVDSGVRAIFCEKPFTLDSAQAVEAVRRCAARGIVLAVNHQRRWEPGHRRVRADIAAGRLGRIQQVRGLYYGGLIRVGSHLVDLLRFFLGEVETVEVLAAHDETQGLDVQLRFENGTPAVLQACRREYFEVFEVDVLGTEGRVEITDFGHRVRRWRVGPSEEYPGDGELHRSSDPVCTEMRGAFLRAVADIVDCVNFGREPLCSGRDALGTVAVIERICAAANVSR